MDIFLFTTALSFSGLTLMALSGLGQHHAHGKASIPHAHGHGIRAAKFHRGSRPQHGGSRAGMVGAMLLGLLSPRVFLSVLLGFGATGLLLRPLAHWPTALLFAVAAIGGFAFEQLLVAPLWRILFGFASRPAETLDAITVPEGEAATDFDADGHGLIAVQLDGQVRQILATLCPEERAAAGGDNSTRIRTGEHLFIRTVNRQRNTCTVSRLSC